MQGFLGILALLMTAAGGGAGGDYYVASAATTTQLADICAEDPSRPMRADFCTGYILATYDRMSFSDAICPSLTATSAQAVAVARKYIADHPERWDTHPSVVVAEALRTAFPCR